MTCGCRVSWVGQVSAQPPWLTGRSRVESRHWCPGDLRPGSPYEALLKGPGGFWGNPAQLWLCLFCFTFNHSLFHTYNPSFFLNACVQDTLRVKTVLAYSFLSLLYFSVSITVEKLRYVYLMSCMVITRNVCYKRIGCLQNNSLFSVWCIIFTVKQFECQNSTAPLKISKMHQILYMPKWSLMRHNTCQTLWKMTMIHKRYEISILQLTVELTIEFLRHTDWWMSKQRIDFRHPLCSSKVFVFTILRNKKIQVKKNETHMFSCLPSLYCCACFWT